MGVVKKGKKNVSSTPGARVGAVEEDDDEERKKGRKEGRKEGREKRSQFGFSSLCHRLSCWNSFFPRVCSVSVG